MPLRFKGIQKLSLIDYPDKICCTLFLGGCNFRCGYCHNPSLVLPADDGFDFSEEEVLSFLNERKNFLDGICVSGGEPLLHDDLLSFLKKIKLVGI
ncbi:MAG: radical SAM protein, partial [Candidatus Margulisiibacteriota bacterium]